MEKFVDIGDEERVHCLELGKGEPLVLLPSLGCSSRSYRALGEALSKYYRVYVADIYKGKSVFHRTTLSLADYVSQLHRFITSLRLKKFYLVGVSASGGLVTQYVETYPRDIKKLVLVTSYVVPLGVPNRAWWLFSSYCLFYFHNMFSVRGIRTNILLTVDGLGNLILHPQQMINEYLMAVSVNVPAPKRMPAPTKVYFARHDEFIPFRLLPDVKKIKNLDVEVVDTYHTWFFYREDELAKKIFAFFGN